MSLFNRQERLNKRLAKAIYWVRPKGTIAAILEAGAEVNSNQNGRSAHPLYLAAIENSTDTIELLLTRGADPNLPERGGNTPLVKAVQKQNYTAARAIAEAGAKLDAQNEKGEAALLLAAAQGDADFVTFLVERGADINIRGKDGNTALHIAALKGLANLARYLIDNGADVTIANASMNTAADVAEKEYPRLAAMIRGLEAPDAPAGVSAQRQEWQLTAEAEVARVAEKPLIGYRVTEIFNFNARLYTQIARNLETNAESQTVKAFGELDDGRAVEAARAALESLGGRIAGNAPDKKKLAAPGLGGGA